MHIHIDERHPENFRVTNSEGRDITKELRLTKISVSADYSSLVKVVLECYATIDIFIDEGKLKVVDASSGAYLPRKKIELHGDADGSSCGS